MNEEEPFKVFQDQNDPMPRALRSAFTFLSPDQHLISLFMTRRVSV